jgi:hypothetical protein
MNSILPGTIEEPGLEIYKVGTLEAPSGGAWSALEAVRLTLYWLDGRGPPWAHLLRPQDLKVINVAAGRSGRPNKPLGLPLSSKPQVAFRTF